jgi:hypothetical protein
MAFWQTFFIILGSVLAGLGLSLAVIYVITKVQKKPMFPAQKRNQMAAEKALPESTTMLSTVKTKLAEKEENNLEELLKNHKKPESVSVKIEVAGAQSQSPEPGSGTKSGTKPTIATASATIVENKKPESSRNQKRAETPRKQSPPPRPAVSRKVETEPAMVAAPVIPIESKREVLLKNLEKTEPVKEQSSSPKSDILKELESNLALATAPWAGKLTPFQTTFWDSDHLKVEPLLAKHQEEITQVYIDIRLANSIVWLSNEVGHRSADLDESYKQLCTKIAERLKKVITSPENVK